VFAPQLPSIEPLETRVLFAAGKILFIRGGSGTGGFLDGGTLAQRDEELADITNFSTAKGNHGWGELANLLRGDGFAPMQAMEKHSNPIDLSKLDLSQYKTIVFGSNNADYGAPRIVSALVKYIDNGGSALFISDANFGSSYGDAPSSDQSLLTPFGLAVNQDSGTYSLSRSTDFRAPQHPILFAVNQIDGEGVSPGVRVRPVKHVTPQVLIGAKGTTRNNNSLGKGTDRPVTQNDGALVVAEAGLGRIAISFDRNTFFNRNGAGTDIHRFDNARYAKNLFEWLAGRNPGRPQVQAEDFRYDESPQSLLIAFNRNVAASLSGKDIALKNRTTGKGIAASSVRFDTLANTAIFRFPTTLASGSYTVTLFAKGVMDSNGKTLLEDVVYNFRIL
jgi:hypothetical protein